MLSLFRKYVHGLTRRQDLHLSMVWLRTITFIYRRFWICISRWSCSAQVGGTLSTGYLSVDVVVFTIRARGAGGCSVVSRATHCNIKLITNSLVPWLFVIKLSMKYVTILLFETSAVTCENIYAIVLLMSLYLNEFFSEILKFLTYLFG